MESFTDSARPSANESVYCCVSMRAILMSTVYNNLVILVSTSLVFSVGERCLIAATSLSIIQLCVNYVFGIATRESIKSLEALTYTESLCIYHVCTRKIHTHTYTYTKNFD